MTAKRTTILNASAGSGKTYRLAVAYLQALLVPQADGSMTSPQQVLATTFTRAAASEILERVLKRLAQAVVSDHERRKLLADIKGPEMGQKDLAALLRTICTALPQLQVGTIDALFARMVRVIGLDLAFPSAWTVADESLAADLALEAADRMLSVPEAQVSREQWRRFTQFRSGIRVRAALVDLLESNRFQLVDAAVGEDDPELAAPLTLPAVEVAAIAQEIDAFDGHPLTKQGRPNEYFVKALREVRSKLSGEVSAETLLKNNFFRLHAREGSTYYKIQLPASLRKILSPVAQRVLADAVRLHGARLPALAAMARRYHDYRRLVAYASAAYSFPEIETAARYLPEHLNANDLYFRLDGQVQHLLLDEFQDTSLSQFRFLWPIMVNLRSEDRLLFTVGDVKQSIYGWRGADRHLLNHLAGWLDASGQEGLQVETLQTNYRSAPSVLTAIDRIFGDLKNFRCLAPESYKKKADLALVRQRAAESFGTNYVKLAASGENRLLAGRVRLIVTRTPDDDDHGAEPDDATPGDEVEAILATAVEHARQDPEREIAILCRRRKFIPTIIAGLRRRGVEASGEGGSPVTDSAAAELVLSMLTWLDHPGHTLAREHVRLSGLAAVFGMDDGAPDRFLPKRIQTVIMRDGLASVVAGWVRHGEFRTRGTAHDQIRCEQLVELARHWDAAGGGRLAHFVERVRAQKLENPISSRVRVMTIHASKGLEFDAVIVADLQTSKSGKRGPEFLVETTTPGGPPRVQLVPTEKEAELLGDEARNILERHRQNQFEEDLSVLYVAITRAKSFLDVVITEPKNDGPTLAAILQEGWGAPNAGVHVVEQNEAVAPERPATPFDMAADGMISANGAIGAPRFVAAPERLAAITPSGQEGAGVVKLGVLLKTEGSAARDRGTAVHALLSHIEWNDRVPAIDAWAALVPEREARAEICRKAARELHPRLRKAGDPLAQVFDATRWKTDGIARLEVWRERRFAVQLDRELMNGSFDRVVCGFDAKGKLIRATIVDFKTDSVVTPAEREERGRYYQPQLDAYARALGKLTGLSATAIQTQLVWINPGVV